MGYWGRVIRRGVDDAKPWFGMGGPRRSVPRILIGAAVVVIAASLLVIAKLVTRDAWYWALLAALGGWIVLVLLANWARAPDRMDREQQARIVALSEGIESRTIGEHEIEALQSAYAVGRELLRAKANYEGDDMGARVTEWSIGTAELLRRCGSRNDGWAFATGADFVAPTGEKTPSAVLLMRLSKLKHIIDRLIEQHEGGGRRGPARRGEGG